MKIFKNNYFNLFITKLNLIDLYNDFIKLRSEIYFIILGYKFKTLVKKTPRKIIVGAGGVFHDGWVPSDIGYFNILKPGEWQKYFHKNSIDAILAEHVWEHLTKDEGAMAANLCFQYLKKGGYIRIAVPDGMSPNQEYIEYVRPSGKGLGADDHKILYDYKSLKEILEVSGFKVDLLEYYDENGIFHFKEWDPRDGKINRSKRFDERNLDNNLNYTSIIVDAKKEI